MIRFRHVVIVPFSADLHLHECVEVLRRVRASDATYPPQRDVGGDPDSFAAWLLDYPALGRWVAVIDGVVTGHVMVSTPHDYLVEHIGDGLTQGPLGGQIAEIAKFFVDPLFQRRGVGEALLSESRAFSWAKGLQPSLAVVATSVSAVRLYERAGLKRRGSFQGVHGENLVFVDERPGSGAEMPLGFRV